MRLNQRTETAGDDGFDAQRFAGPRGAEDFDGAQGGQFQARPGETLRIEAVITGCLGSLIQAHVSASVADAKVLSAEIALSGNGPAEKS